MFADTILPLPLRVAAGCAGIACVIATGIAATAASAHTPAHVHGRLSLDVAVDAGMLTLRIDSPLDNLLGFERAPRTDAERKAVADMIGKFEAAHRMLRPDPVAQCTLSSATTRSAELGLGDGNAQRPSAASGDGHAEIEVTIVFHCARSASARFIDVGLFDAFKGIRTIDAQVASPQGQFKRRLTPRAPRLTWGR